MDNLELMKQMEDESIDLIYCDILYGTGRKFDDFQDLKPDRQIIEDFYIPRIKEMHRILKNTGTIYLQMDYRITHWIRIIMDEIFSYDNLRAEIIWWYTWGIRTKKCWNKKHDNILMYSKNNSFTFNADEVLEERVLQPQSKQRLKYKGAMIKDYNNRNSSMALPIDVWYIPTLNGMSKERVGYDTQKPKALLERIIKASSNKGDIVADFFCGSGTTGVVAKELGRNYIMCDINPRAIEISEKRLSEAQSSVHG